MKLISIIAMLFVRLFGWCLLHLLVNPMLWFCFWFGSEMRYKDEFAAEDHHQMSKCIWELKRLKTILEKRP